MYIQIYDRIKKSIIVLQLLLSATSITIVCLVHDHAFILKSICATVGGLCLLSIFLWFINERCMSHLVTDLTTLIDTLTSLEEIAIFPENEDTLPSKLQNKIIRLTHILKKKEQLSYEAQENMKGLIADISHQLKTPISNLLMYTEFLKEPDLSDKTKQEYVGIIRLSVERLSFLTEHMVKLSRLESGLITLHPEKQAINETILKAIKDIFPKAQGHGHTLTYEDEPPLLIRHDRNWTAEALFNILDNAVKYSKPDSTIQIRLRQYGLFVAIEITNEGTGIDETEHSKIFTRFYRGQNSRQTEGIGIGLYLSREILVRQGGYISLKVHGGQTTFLLCLPIEPVLHSS